MHARTLIVLAAALQLSACANFMSDQAALYDQLTDQDVNLAAETLQRSLETLPDGATQRWANEGTGHEGAVTATRTYLSAGGQFCRDYREDLRLGDQTAQFFHAACRDEEGGWIWL